MRESPSIPGRGADVFGAPLRRGDPPLRAGALILAASLLAGGVAPVRGADAGAAMDQDCPQCRGTGREACPECRGEGKLYHPCRICSGTGQRTCLRCSGYAQKYGPGRVPCPACGAVARVWNDGAGAYGPCPTCKGTGGIACSSCNGTAKVPCPTHSFDRICPLCRLAGRIPCRRCRGTGVVSAEGARSPDSGSAPQPEEAGPPSSAEPPSSVSRPAAVPPQKPVSDLFEELAATVAEIDRQVGNGWSQEEVRKAIEEFKRATAGAPDPSLAAQGNDLLRRARELDAAIGAILESWRDARGVAERALSRYRDTCGMEGPALAENDTSLRATLLSGIRRCDAVADTLSERDLAAKWSALREEMAAARRNAEQAIARAAEEKAAAAAPSPPPASSAPAPPAPERGSQGAGPTPGPPRPPTPSAGVAQEPAPPAPPGRASGPEAGERAGERSWGDALAYLVIAILLAIVAFETAAILRRAPGRRAMPDADSPGRSERLRTGARFTKGG